jgi:hypothetical protein
MRDWEEIRRAAVHGESLESLARRYDIAYGTLKNRAVREQWDVQAEGSNNTAEGDAFARIAGKLLRLIEDGLDGEKSFDLKEIKTLTGALKELQSLGEEKDGAKGGGLTVRFVGEAEEMSE